MLREDPCADFTTANGVAGGANTASGATFTFTCDQGKVTRHRAFAALMQAIRHRAMRHAPSAPGTRRLVTRCADAQTLNTGTENESPFPKEK